MSRRSNFKLAAYAAMAGVLSHFSFLNIPYLPRLNSGVLGEHPFRLKKWVAGRNGYGLNAVPIDANVNRLRRRRGEKTVAIVQFKNQEILESIKSS